MPTSWIRVVKTCGGKRLPSACKVCGVWCLQQGLRIQLIVTQLSTFYNIIDPEKDPMCTKSLVLKRTRCVLSHSASSLLLSFMSASLFFIKTIIFMSPKWLIIIITIKIYNHIIVCVLFNAVLLVIVTFVTSDKSWHLPPWLTSKIPTLEAVLPEPHSVFFQNFKISTFGFFH